MLSKLYGIILVVTVLIYTKISTLDKLILLPNVLSTGCWGICGVNVSILYLQSALVVRLRFEFRDRHLGSYRCIINAVVSPFSK